MTEARFTGVVPFSGNTPGREINTTDMIWLCVCGTRPEGTIWIRHLMHNTSLKPSGFLLPESRRQWWSVGQGNLGWQQTILRCGRGAVPGSATKEAAEKFGHCHAWPSGKHMCWFQKMDTWEPKQKPSTDDPQICQAGKADAHGQTTGLQVDGLRGSEAKETTLAASSCCTCLECEITEHYDLWLEKMGFCGGWPRTDGITAVCPEGCACGLHDDMGSVA